MSEGVGDLDSFYLTLCFLEKVSSINKYDGIIMNTQRLLSLSKIFFSLRLNPQRSSLKKMARDSDLEYQALANLAFESLTGASRRGFNEVDPNLGPLLQITQFASDPIYEQMSFKKSRKIDDIQLFVFRPLSRELLERYGLPEREIQNCYSNYGDCFRWTKNIKSEFEPIDNGVKILLYPNKEEFSKIEANIGFLSNYSWLALLVRINPLFKQYFDHEFSHVINYIRGFSEENKNHLMSNVDYANSTDEVRARIVELFSALSSEIARGNPDLINFISSGNYQGFLNYALSKYKEITLLDLATEKTKNIYKNRLIGFFLELRDKIP